MWAGGAHLSRNTLDMVVGKGGTACMNLSMQLPGLRY